MLSDLPLTTYRFIIWQCTFGVKLRKMCPITLVFGKTLCCDCRRSSLS